MEQENSLLGPEMIIITFTHTAQIKVHFYDPVNCPKSGNVDHTCALPRREKNIRTSIISQALLHNTFPFIEYKILSS